MKKRHLLVSSDAYCHCLGVLHCLAWLFVMDHECWSLHVSYNAVHAHCPTDLICLWFLLVFIYPTDSAIPLCPRMKLIHMLTVSIFLCAYFSIVPTVWLPMSLFYFYAYCCWLFMLISLVYLLFYCMIYELTSIVLIIKP